MRFSIFPRKIIDLSASGLFTIARGIDTSKMVAPETQRSFVALDFAFLRSTDVSILIKVFLVIFIFPVISWRNQLIKK